MRRERDDGDDYHSHPDTHAYPQWIDVPNANTVRFYQPDAYAHPNTDAYPHADIHRGLCG